MTTYSINYKQFFKGLGDPHCIISKSGIILSANRSFAALAGEAEESIVKNKLRAYLAEDSGNEFHALLQNMMVSAGHIKLRFANTGGKDYFFSYNLDESLHQIYLTLNRFVEDHRLMQQRLRMYENIIYNNWDAIVFSDLNGQILVTNKAADSLYEYTSDELIGQNIDIFSVESDNRSKEIVNSLKNEGNYSGRLLHKKKDKTEFLCLFSVNMVYDETGNPIGLVSNCKDISLETEAQEVLHEADQTKAALASAQQVVKTNQERLRVFENIIINNWDAIIFSDLAGNILISNDSATRLYGYTEEELEGANIDVFNTENAAHVPAMVAGLKEQGGWSGEILHRHSSNREFNVLLTVSMIFDVNGQPVGLVSTSKDITDRVNAENEATKKNEELLQVKDRFVHELEEQVKLRTEQFFEEKEKADKLLLNILPHETANELKLKGVATPRQYNNATILFTDFVNFTKISEKLNAEELIQELNSFFTAFDDIIIEHGIEKIKTIGDAYMCVSGLPTETETHAVDMVKAAVKIEDFVRNINLEKKQNEQPLWELRLGINTGPVIAGVVGKNKFAYDIWGDAVNIASRIESSGETGKINISKSTFDLVKDTFECEHRGKVHAKNKGDIDMYFVKL